jgi:hypothetical protein
LSFFRPTSFVKLTWIVVRHEGHDILHTLPCGLLLHPQLQIFESIVSAAAVLVVDRFPGPQAAAEVLLHHVAMFQIAAAVHSDDAVTARIKASGTSSGFEEVRWAGIAVLMPSVVMQGTVAAPIDGLSTALDRAFTVALHAFRDHCLPVIAARTPSLIVRPAEATLPRLALTSLNRALTLLCTPLLKLMPLADRVAASRHPLAALIGTWH